MGPVGQHSIDPSPPLLKPQLFSVGAFSRLMATVPACLRGFMRTPADFAGCLSGPFSAAFRSLLAILLPGFALREWPGVRKGTVQHPFKSTGYARTVQAVGSRHCLPGGELPRPGGCPLLFHACRCSTGGSRLCTRCLGTHHWRAQCHGDEGGYGVGKHRMGLMCRGANRLCIDHGLTSCIVALRGDATRNSMRRIACDRVQAPDGAP